MGDIYLHEKYGLNPSMTQCFFCLEPKEIILPGRRTGALKKAGVPVAEDGEMPRMAGVFDMEPCKKCQEYMEQGIILIQVTDDSEGGPLDEIYRLGGWVVIKEEAMLRMVTLPSLAESIKEKRWAFMPDSIWQRFGLPTANSPTT